MGLFFEELLVEIVELLAMMMSLVDLDGIFWFGISPG
jgi:hypothetical protein